MVWIMCSIMVYKLTYTCACIHFPPEMSDWPTVLLSYSPALLCLPAAIISFDLTTSAVRGDYSSNWLLRYYYQKLGNIHVELETLPIFNRSSKSPRRQSYVKY